MLWKWPAFVFQLLHLVYRVLWFFKRSAWRASHPIQQEEVRLRHGSLLVRVIPAHKDNLSYVVSSAQDPSACVSVDLWSSQRCSMHLATHWHPDHARAPADGSPLHVSEVDAPRCPLGSAVVGLRHQQQLRVGELRVDCIATPCHTMGSMCFLIRHGSSAVLCCGDTLFLGGGAGKFFEGTGEDMLRSLSRLKECVPPDTLLLPGHEYAEANAAWAGNSIEHSRLPYLVSFAEERRKCPASLNQLNGKLRQRFAGGHSLVHRLFQQLPLLLLYSAPVLAGAFADLVKGLAEARHRLALTLGRQQARQVVRRNLQLPGGGALRRRLYLQLQKRLLGHVR